jgi:hypothetical protein
LPEGACFDGVDTEIVGRGDELARIDASVNEDGRVVAQVARRLLPWSPP